MMYLISLIIFSAIINLPLAKKPLSEDDGNWFYPAVFWNRGLRLYKNFSYATGYFCIHWIAAKIYNLFKVDNFSFFYYLKNIWYSLTAVSIYWMSYCFWHDPLLAFISGSLFSLITALPNNLFALTYGESFIILPVNLSIIFTFYGITTGNCIFIILAGLMASWSCQIKPTGLLFSIILPISFCFAPNIFSNISIYIISFVGFTCLPLFFIHQYEDKTRIYFRGLLVQIIIFTEITVNKIGIEIGSKYLTILYEYFEIPQASIAYIENHHKKTLKIQWQFFKINMMPSIKDVYLILVLGFVQIIMLFISFDIFVVLIILLLLVLLLTYFFQKNYYTPHFNPCWMPVSILAAKTVYDMWPYLLNSGALGWAMIVFVVIEAIKISGIIIKSFSKNQINTFGFLDPILGILFRLCESIGKYIQQDSKENDKLFVWGDQPSIYLYAKREIFNTDYLFLYAHNQRIIKEKEILSSLRKTPPELLLFYNYKVNDGWNIKKLQETIGITYDLLKSFKLEDSQGKIIFNFPLYRRNDSKYREILLERASIAQKTGDIDASHMHLDTLLKIFPKDYEALAQLSLLENCQDEPDKIEKYLERQLAENHEPEKCSVIFRILADKDLEKGDFNKAKENFEKALELNPDDYRSYNGLGEIYFASGNREKALFFFNKAFELNRYSADILNNLGVVCMKSGNKKDSINFFKLAASIMPSHHQVAENLKYVTESTGLCS